MQKQELPVVAMFVNGSELNEHLYRGHTKDASYQISIHLAKRFQRRIFFRIQPIRPVVAMFVNQSGRNEYSLKRTFQGCFLPSGFRGEDFFRNQPIRNKNCLWWPCLLTDRN
jgi:hypothetical protein